jgi:hypothetical protein
VPVAAARQAEVGPADPQPMKLLRGGEHVVEERPVGLLEGVALDQGPARLGDPAGERVADLLELPQVEHPRRSRGFDPVRDDDAPEALGDQPGELMLELGDLPAQLGAGQTLIDRDPFEHSPHSRSLSRLEGGRGNP